MVMYTASLQFLNIEQEIKQKTTKRSSIYICMTCFYCILYCSSSCANINCFNFQKQQELGNSSYYISEISWVEDMIIYTLGRLISYNTQLPRYWYLFIKLNFVYGKFSEIKSRKCVTEEISRVQVSTSILV